MTRALARRDLLRGAAACGLGLAGLSAPALLGCGRRRDLRRVYLRVEGAAGLPSDGLGVLLADHLESLGGFAVLPWPAPDHPLPARSRATLLRLSPRLGDRGLAFDVEVSYPSGLRRPVLSLPPAEPLQTFTRLAGGLPLQLTPPSGEALCPGDGQVLAPLLEVLADEDDPRRGPERLAFSRALARAHPGCATAQFLYANQLYNQLLLHPLEQAVQWGAFQAYRAGLASVPDHPRGVSGFSQLLADSGLHRDGLSLLEAALGRHPAVPSLHRALAYLARTAGLLDLALRALAELGRLTDGQPRSHCENTYLYAGEAAAHRATCRLEGTGRDTRVHFYLGYLALAAGDRDGAREAFRAARTIPGGWYGFEGLASVLALALEDGRPEALARLKALADQRSALRAPDGEFTFKLAEVAAFLGQTDQALELGELAFTQGFGCTRWYERSPFLAPVRGTARWQVLHGHLLERQSLLESRYPPRRFGL